MTKNKMRSGWLWFDNDASQTLTEKATRAADAYRARFGHKPNTCYANPSQVAEEFYVNGLRVAPAGHVLLHHFWLGVECET